VMAATSTLTDAERGALLGRIEFGLSKTKARNRFASVALPMFFLGMAALIGLGFDEPLIAALFVAFGIYMIWLAVTSAKRNSPAHMAEVFATLRDHPSRITRFAHSAARYKWTVTHFVIVCTERHSLVIMANDDWRWILSGLARYCPNAANDSDR